MSVPSPAPLEPDSESPAMITPTPFGPWQKECVTVNGSSKLKRRSLLPPGSPEEPTLAANVQGWERYGIFFTAEGPVVALFGFARFRFTNEGLVFQDMDGVRATLRGAGLSEDQVLAFPDRTGTVATRESLRTPLDWVSEAPDGDVDGSNVDFSTSRLPEGGLGRDDASRVQVFADGVFLVPEVGYTRAGRALSLAVAPSTSLWSCYHSKAAVWADDGAGYAPSGSFGGGRIANALGSGYAPGSTFGSGKVVGRHAGTGYAPGETFGSGSIS